MGSKNEISLRHPLLDCIGAEILAEYTQNGLCRLHLYEAGSDICSTEHNTQRLCILLKGDAIAYTSGCRKQVILRTFRAGAVFGVSDWYSENILPQSIIRAKSDCRLFELTAEAMRRLLDEVPAFRHAYISFLTGRITFLNQKIHYLTAGSAESKLSSYLLSLGEPDEVELDMPLSAISEMLDLGRASLYRAFDTLVKDGFIEKHGKKIRLCDREGMSRHYTEKDKI